uniref:Enoyl-CoA delta isomerase 1, mitochondrial n=1 Tax=Timema poppense TaxID=170557 RepID=A0A7R9CL79_TIMPO|nr:unnamed protein product [Timema poppensis]
MASLRQLQIVVGRLFISHNIHAQTIPHAINGARGLVSIASSGKLVDVATNEKTGVSTVTLQRPPVNSLNLELLQEFTATLDELRKSKSRGMILTSASPTVFSAGLDLLEMYRPKSDRIRLFWSKLQEMWLKLYGSTYPTVAAINGHSPAGGCLLALSCDYRVMVGPKYTIGLNETQLGIIAPRWFQDTMLNTIPRRQAELALTTGRMFSTEEALNVGLIDEVATNKSDAIAKAESFLNNIAKIPASACQQTKLQFRKEALDNLKNNLDSDLQIFVGFLETPKIQKSLELYLESLKKKV